MILIKQAVKFKNEFLIGLLFCFPLVPLNLTGFIGVFVAFLLYVFNVKKAVVFNIDKRLVFLSIGFVVIYMISIIYSSNYNKGLKEVLKSILLIIFPFLFLRHNILTKKNINSFLIVYVIVNVLLCVYIYNLAIDILSYKKMVFLKEASLFTRLKTFYNTPFHIPFNWSSRDFEVKLFFHKAYMSISFCLSTFIAIYFILFTKIKKAYKLILILTSLLFVYFIFYLGSIPNILCLILGVIILLIYRINSIKIIISLLTIISVLLYIKRESVIIKYNQSINRIETDFRVNIWECSVSILKDNYFLGVGIGDKEDKLIECYTANPEKYKRAISSKMNTHNQYLSLMLSSGIICLILFLALQFINLKFAFKYQDILFILFTILILINFTFESMLHRIYGIYFFSLFNSFFILRNQLLLDENFK